MRAFSIAQIRQSEIMWSSVEKTLPTGCCRNTVFNLAVLAMSWHQLGHAKQANDYPEKFDAITSSDVTDNNHVQVQPFVEEVAAAFAEQN